MPAGRHAIVEEISGRIVNTRTFDPNAEEDWQPPEGDKVIPLSATRPVTIGYRWIDNPFVAPPDHEPVKESALRSIPPFEDTVEAIRGAKTLAELKIALIEAYGGGREG